MTRQDMIDKLFNWYWEWAKRPEEYEYFEDRERDTRLRTDKLNHLNAMTDEQLKDLYIMELMRREGYVKNES